LDRLEAIPVAAYNLALAEKTGLDLVTPCTGCFVTFTKAKLQLEGNPNLISQVNQALAAANLEYKGKVRVRLLTEVLINDAGFEFISSKSKGGLNGLKIAPYYGCQLVRPNFGFDDPEAPQKLDDFVNNLGAEAVPFPMKARCCGSSLIISEEGVALELIYKLLKNAFKNGAQCIVTPCPLCQINLDAYQSKVNSRFKSSFKLPVLFVTQLIGLALGIDYKSLGLNTNIVSPRPVLEHISRLKQEVQSGT
jgi:heterodisulfide reductase subunit B